MNPQLPITTISETLRLMLPEIFLFIWAIIVLSFSKLNSQNKNKILSYFTLSGILITGILLFVAGDGIAFGKMFINNPLSLFFKIIFLTVACMTVGLSYEHKNVKIQNFLGNYFSLILFSTVGMMLIASSQELISLYIAIELATIPLLVLVSFYKNDKLSVESGIKYFIISAFSSALLLYGFSFLYGISGTTGLLQMSVNIASVHLTHSAIGFIVLIATVCIIASVSFKLAIPPFHQWASDVYSNSPAPVVAFLSVASKIVGLLIFIKIFFIGLWGFLGIEMQPNDWGLLVGSLSVVAMIVGSVQSLKQTNMKRMMAYSSIAQVGYILIGLLALNEQGVSSVVLYISVYVCANMGAFAALTVFENKTGSTDMINLKGIAQASPFFASTLSIFMLSLAGLPLLGGFVAKYKVFTSALNQTSYYGFAWLYFLVGVGIVTSFISLFCYYNIIKEMYSKKEISMHQLSYNTSIVVVVIFCLFGTILLGVYPDPILKFANKIYYTFSFSIPK